MMSESPEKAGRQPPKESSAAIARYPAPDRAFYFTGRDYAAACKRIHEKRLKFDKHKG